MINVLYRNPLAQMEEEKREHDMKMKKMEAEMEQVFEMKVKEKKQKLKDSEAELTRRHEERKKVTLNMCAIHVFIESNCQVYCIAKIFNAIQLLIEPIANIFTKFCKYLYRFLIY